PMIDVPDRPDIHVRLTALEFLLRHIPSTLCVDLVPAVLLGRPCLPNLQTLERGTGFELYPPKAGRNSLLASCSLKNSLPCPPFKIFSRFRASCDELHSST